MSDPYKSVFREEMVDSTFPKLDFACLHVDKDSLELGSRNSLASCVGLSGNDDGDDGKPLEDNVFRTPRRPRRRGPGAGTVRGVVGGPWNRKATVSSATTTRQDMIAFRRQVWRFRLGSHGDRCSLSPPEMTARDMRKVRLKCRIGMGGFGSVYLGVFKDRIVAVKKLHRCVKNVEAKVESFRAECNVLHLKHPNIVRVLAASLGDPRTQEAVLVMEYAGEQNLQHIVDDLKQKLTFERRTKYALEISQGLSYIHDNHVVHLDLKPANIIITSRDNCKLADFGCCQVLEDDEEVEARVSPPPRSCLGTFAYRAPELLRGEPATTKADIFSFGVTLWQLLVRDAPYSGKNQHVVIFGVVAYNVRPVLPKTGQRGRCLSPEERCYVDLFCKCWNADVNQRPTAAALVDVFRVWRQQVSTS